MGRKRNYDAFARAVDRAINGGHIEALDDGELVIYTGLTMDTDEQGNETGKVRAMTEDEIMGFAS